MKRSGKRRFLSLWLALLMVLSLTTGMSFTAAAVSYTHLDVYKRQIKDGSERQCSEEDPRRLHRGE